MNDLDYESLFNQILIKSRDRRRSLKADLDQAFDVDPRATTDILKKMIEAVDRSTQLDGVRSNFQELLKRLRRVRLTRDELIAKVDELYGAMRGLLELKDELTDGALPTLTALFREELGNHDFKFSFNVIDEHEVEALSTFRSGARGPAAARPLTAVEPPSPPPARELEREPSRCGAPTPTPMTARNQHCATAFPDEEPELSLVPDEIPEPEAVPESPAPTMEMSYDEEPRQVNARLDDSFDLPDLGPPPSHSITADPEPARETPAAPQQPGPTPSLLDDLDSFDLETDTPAPPPQAPTRPGYRFGLAPVADDSDEILPPLGHAGGSPSTDDFFPGEPEEIEVTLESVPAPAPGEEPVKDDKDETYEVEVDVLKILSDD